MIPVFELIVFRFEMIELVDFEREGCWGSQHQLQAVMDIRPL